MGNGNGGHHCSQIYQCCALLIISYDLTFISWAYQPHPRVWIVISPTIPLPRLVYPCWFIHWHCGCTCPYLSLMVGGAGTWGFNWGAIGFLSSVGTTDTWERGMLSRSFQNNVNQFRHCLQMCPHHLHLKYCQGTVPLWRAALLMELVPLILT